MARTVDQIKIQITEQVNANPLFTLLAANPSQVALFKSWIFIQAVAIALFEQIIDIFTTRFEADIETAPPGSDPWLRKKVLEFQYDAITPQVVQLDTVTMSVGYNPVDTTKRIITRASVKTTGTRIATFKVAKGEPPQQISGPELSALNTYLSTGGDGTYNGRGVGIGFAGVKYAAVSYQPDRLYLKATIFYDGQYSATIKEAVIVAINEYFKNIYFDGTVKVLSLTDYIQDVPGVSDILIEDLATRAQATPFASKTYIIQNFQEFMPSYVLYAGYVIEEDEPSQDFLNTLTFSAI